MDHRLANIERLCRIFLNNFDHVSRREVTEKTIRELHAATDPRLEKFSPQPPTLGISVSDGLAAKSKVR